MMLKISLVAAVDQNLGLGRNNALLCHLPADLKHFKNLTLGKPIIMGRKTFESIGRVLPGRQNIILSHQALTIEGAIVSNALESALDLLVDIPEVMVIGGAGLFKQALPIAETVYLTKIKASFEADVFFPCLNEQEWQLVDEQFRSQDSENPYDLYFCQYSKKPQKA